MLSKLTCTKFLPVVFLLCFYCSLSYCSISSCDILISIVEFFWCQFEEEERIFYPFELMLYLLVDDRGPSGFFVFLKNWKTVGDVRMAGLNPESPSVIAEGWYSYFFYLNPLAAFYKSFFVLGSIYYLWNDLLNSSLYVFYS